MKQFVAYAMIGSITIAIITAVIEPFNEDNWYALSGIGLFVFGAWASVLLLKK